MPRNVRNFWIELEVDGKKSRIATGPVRKDGGFRMTIKQRSSGRIIRAVDLCGRIDSNGLLRLGIVGPDSSMQVVTER